MANPPNNNLSTSQKAAAGVAAVVLLAVPLIKPLEGMRTRAYLDSIGVPTICVGETLGVHLGDTSTVAKCEDRLVHRLTQMDNDMDKCIRVTLPKKTEVAFLLTTYNIGAGAFCRSTIARKINAGDVKGACNELPKWNRAGGRVLAGLVKRRAYEQKLCLQELA